MLIPVRCFTCGKVIGSLWEPYKEYVSKRMCEGVLEKDAKHEALEKLFIRRYCCRRMILAHVDVIDKIIKYV